MQDDKMDAIVFSENTMKSYLTKQVGFTPKHSFEGCSKTLGCVEKSYSLHYSRF